jgi:hypothetical protein
MNQINSKPFRILAIAPTTRGVGFAVLEETLVDWGVKTIKGEKNKQSVAKVRELISNFRPSVIALQNTKGSHRSDRIKVLSKKLIAMAATHKVKMVLFSHEQTRRAFFPEGLGTKHAVAEIIAQQFPEELGSRLPPKRRPWTNESHNMTIFDAAALAMVFRLKQGKTNFSKCGIP